MTYCINSPYIGAAIYKGHPGENTCRVSIAVSEQGVNISVSTLARLVKKPQALVATKKEARQKRAKQTSF